MITTAKKSVLNRRIFQLTSDWTTIRSSSDRSLFLVILQESVKHFRNMPFYTKSKLDHCHFSANFYFWSLCHIVTISSQFFVSILCLCITPVSLGAAVCHKCNNLSHCGHGGGRSQDSCNTAVEFSYLIGLSELVLWLADWVLGFNNNYKTFQLSFF